MLTFLSESPLVESIGWLLVHSLWQFAAVALVSAALLALLRRASAEARYRTGLIALAAMAALPPGTWFCLPLRTAAPTAARELSPMVAAPLPPHSIQADSFREPAAQAEPHRAVEPAAGAPAAVQPPAPHSSATAWWPRIERAVTPWLPLVVVAWCGGVLLFALRPLTSWLAIRRLRASGTPVPPAIEDALARLAKRLKLGRAVNVVQSALVRAPVVIGWLRPLILLPVSIVCELPPAQLDAILAHELAHVRRHDFLVNVLQT